MKNKIKKKENNLNLPTSLEVEQISCLYLFNL